MTKQTKNKIVTVVAILLLAVAIFLTIQLIIGEDGEASETEAFSLSETEPITTAVNQPETESTATKVTASAKYLWEYGPDSAKSDNTYVLK